MMLAIRTEDPVKACHLYRVAKKHKSKLQSYSPKKDRDADFFWVFLVSAL